MRSPEVRRITDALVAEALESNLGLDQAEANVDERLAILDQARAEYLPQIDLQLRYSEANGGREIEVPALGLEFQFLRDREQDSFVRLTQPIYDARLAAQRRGASHVYDASRFGLEAFRLRLARDVRQAYYRWLATRESVGVLEATAALAEENERVNDSLYRNGKVTRDLLLRAEAERLEISQQLLRAGAAEDLARRYLNLLCNAPLDREPEVASVTDADLPRLAARIPATRGIALEESAVGQARRAARARRRPRRGGRIGARRTRGIQAAACARGRCRDAGRGMGLQRPGLVRPRLRHPALQPVQRRRRPRRDPRRARPDRRDSPRAARSRSSRSESRCRRRSPTSRSPRPRSRPPRRRVEAAEAAYTIVAKKRDLGQVSPAEYLDSQRALTQARLNGNVTRFQALGALAQVEYAIGGMEQTMKQGNFRHRRRRRARRSRAAATARSRRRAGARRRCASPSSRMRPPRSRCARSACSRRPTKCASHSRPAA